MSLLVTNVALGHAAAELAKTGLPVFPLRPRSKVPATPNGHLDATTDREQIQAWWERFPDANIGCRPPPGFVVVDVDDADEFGRLLDQRGPLPPTLTATTGRGSHYWFKECPQSIAKKLCDGVDLKGNNGYVVMPPSIHPSGARYRWHIEPDCVEIAKMPAWMRDLAVEITQPRGTAQTAQPLNGKLADNQKAWLDKALREEAEAIATTPEGRGRHGGRNGQLNASAWRLYGLQKGWGGEYLTEARVTQALTEAGRACGLPDQEIRYCLKTSEADAKPVWDDKPAPREPIRPAFTIELPDQGNLADDDLFADLSSLLTGELPDPPKPTLLERVDGPRLFYRGEHNHLFGDPEAGKTWVALAAVVRSLDEGGRAVFFDLDHNGTAATINRLLQLGADRARLADRAHFRYCDPQDGRQLLAQIAACATWKADLAVIDCVAEYLSLLDCKNDSSDDYTRAMRYLRKLIDANTAIVHIDHLAKNTDSRNYGQGGTMAKKRAAGGASIRVKGGKPFIPGKGGRAELWVHKDRHGSVRTDAAPPAPGSSSREVHWGDFVLGGGVTEDNEDSKPWHLLPPPQLSTNYTPPRDGQWVQMVRQLHQFTLRQLAARHYGKPEPDLAHGDVEVARRALEQLEAQQLVICIKQGGRGRGNAALYQAVPQADEDALEGGEPWP